MVFLTVELAIIALAMFICINCLFVYWAFLGGRADLNAARIRLIFAFFLTVCLFRTNLKPLTIFLYLFLIAVCSLIFTPAILTRLPKETNINYSTNIKHYLSFYLRYFAKPFYLMFVYLVPAIVLIFIPEIL